MLDLQREYLRTEFGVVIPAENKIAFIDAICDLYFKTAATNKTCDDDDDDASVNRSSTALITHHDDAEPVEGSAVENEHDTVLAPLVSALTNLLERDATSASLSPSAPDSCAPLADLVESALPALIEAVRAAITSEKRSNGGDNSVSDQLSVCSSVFALAQPPRSERLAAQRALKETQQRLVDCKTNIEECLNLCVEWVQQQDEKQDRDDAVASGDAFEAQKNQIYALLEELYRTRVTPQCLAAEYIVAVRAALLLRVEQVVRYAADFFTLHDAFCSDAAAGADDDDQDERNLMRQRVRMVLEAWLRSRRKTDDDDDVDDTAPDPTRQCVFEAPRLMLSVLTDKKQQNNPESLVRALCDRCGVVDGAAWVDRVLEQRFASDTAASPPASSFSFSKSTRRSTSFREQQSTSNSETNGNDRSNNNDNNNNTGKSGSKEDKAQTLLRDLQRFADMSPDEILKSGPDDLLGMMFDVISRARSHLMQHRLANEVAPSVPSSSSSASAEKVVPVVVLAASASSSSNMLFLPHRTDPKLFPSAASTNLSTVCLKYEQLHQLKQLHSQTLDLLKMPQDEFVDVARDDLLADFLERCDEACFAGPDRQRLIERIDKVFTVRLKILHFSGSARVIITPQRHSLFSTVLPALMHGSTLNDLMACELYYVEESSSSGPGGLDRVRVETDRQWFDALKSLRLSGGGGGAFGSSGVLSASSSSASSPLSKTYIASGVNDLRLDLYADAPPRASAAAASAAAAASFMSSPVSSRRKSLEPTPPRKKHHAGADDSAMTLTKPMGKRPARQQQQQQQQSLLNDDDDADDDGVYRTLKISTSEIKSHFAKQQEQQNGLKQQKRDRVAMSLPSDINIDAILRQLDDAKKSVDLSKDLRRNNKPFSPSSIGSGIGGAMLPGSPSTARQRDAIELKRDPPQQQMQQQQPLSLTSRVGASAPKTSFAGNSNKETPNNNIQANIERLARLAEMNRAAKPRQPSSPLKETASPLVDLIGPAAVVTPLLPERAPPRCWILPGSTSELTVAQHTIVGDKFDEKRIAQRQNHLM